MFKRTRTRLLLMVGLLLTLAVGVPSAFAHSAPHTNGTYDNASGHIDYYGTWTHVSGYPTTTFYNGTSSYSNDNNANANIGFLGTGVRYCSDKGPAKGPVVLTIDAFWGTPGISYNYYAPTRVPNVCQTISGLSYANHSLTITNGGSGQDFAVDYIDVLP